MTKPITPDEVLVVKEKLLPDGVIQAVNECIAISWNGSYAMFFQETLITAILQKSQKDISREDIFANKWLDIEDIYRANGWSVKYDKPAYNETYEPTFTFKKKQ